VRSAAAEHAQGIDLMNERFTEVLRELYGADEWLRPEWREFHVFAFAFLPFEVQGLAPQQIQRYKTPPSPELSIDQEQKRPISTTEWSLFDGGSMLVLTAYECDSRAAARAVLLRALGGFQAATPKMEKLVGEIGYVVPPGWTAGMVRGNMVFLAHNGADVLRNVVPLLVTIDRELTREPHVDDDLDVRVGPPTPGFGTRLLELPPLEPSQWYRFLVFGGELQRGEEGLTFNPGSESDGAILFVERISPQGNAGRRIHIR
jgi:hypothetical protein